MTLTPPSPRRSTRPAEPSYERAARRLATASRPMALGAWREVTRTGTLADDPDPDSTAAGLIRRWHQHLAVVIDLPIERCAPGAERLPKLVTAWLDLARRTAAVRAHIAVSAGQRAGVENARQSALLADLLAEDLAALGALEPRRSAADLLQEIAAVAAAEDAAGRVLPDARRSLLGAAGPAFAAAAPRSRRLLCRLTAGLRAAPVS